MDMRKYLDLFVEEANEHIQGATRETGRLAAGHCPPESLNALFRHFHSIKGMAAAMGFPQISALSHAGEDLFDKVRKGMPLPPGQATDLLVEVLDAMAAMVTEAAARGPGTPLPSEAAPLIERLRALIPEEGAKTGAVAKSTPVAASAAGSDKSRRSVYRCVIVIDPRSEMPGARAALVLRKLEEVGEILETTPPRDRLAESGFGGEIVAMVATDRPQPALLAAVKGLVDLKLFEMADAPTAPASPSAGAGADAAAAEAPSMVRVSTAALDHLLDAIAEMLARRGALAEAVRAGDPARAGAELDGMSDSIHRLRDQVMLVRLIPFEHITPRLTRAMRELCRATGKRATLQIAGTGVSLDRSVLEQILDPLLHILRNAVDHGIRPPEERARLGKPETGVVKVEVLRASDGVQIAVEDDGEGMDVAAIRRKAAEGRFVSPEKLAAMDDEQVLMLTTIPGFSTALRVTDVSGRGVGMDIVRTRVEALRGHMTIRSQKAIGTRIDLWLPTSVAILDAFLVESAEGVFAVPASCVTGVQLVARERVRSSLTGRFLATSAEGAHPVFTPLFLLDEALRPRRDASPRPMEIPVLHYQAGGTRGSLGVDRILGRCELVVKPLGPPLERLRRYSGAALLHDGRLALVLDLASLAAGAATAA